MKKGLLERQIRHVLSTDLKSRDSDIRLTQMVWWNHYRSKLHQVNNRIMVDIADLFELPREDHVARIRRKIQNDNKEFLPTTPEIAKKRGMEEDEWRRYMKYPVAGEDHQTL